ncbi:MAG: DUF692 domain-containing protein [Pirellulaceae bacterium]|jgi:hypothetical protein|nr:DUF692 domain-containing protein [Pirellulaceae bacterium]MDP7020656.1 DUF692 domain-containing protein [Pirellulaceae bacterium]
MAWVGLGYRRPWANWIDSRPREIECLEIIAEHFFAGGERRAAELTSRYPVFVHGLGLSLGTPGPLDSETLAHFAAVVDAVHPEWISEHIAFTKSGDIDLGHLNPIAPSPKSLQVIADHTRRVADLCQRPIILENVTSNLRPVGPLSEPEFINRLCEQAECGLLLDVTNLFINSRNHDYDPSAWMAQVDPAHIHQLHVVGYSMRDGRPHDSHAAAIQPEIFELVDEAAGYAPLKAAIIERDSSFPTPNQIAGELRQLREIFDRHGLHSRTGSTTHEP